ncbi:MAG: hypothetical protein M1169_10220 [Firmicutes bacterium]|jgi:putative CRISPR-associated protein (TIGR02619 family)|nr:hypothetical protein [Bacillota bacterium]
MRKVITPVGTSLFENYKKGNAKNDLGDFDQHYIGIKDRPNKDWENCKREIERIQDPLLKWARSSENSSAEIKSILKIKEKVEDELNVYLLASDTITSCVAAEVIKDRFASDKDSITPFFNCKNDVISCLQVNDAESFQRKGMINLINRIYQIANEYLENVIINITGGFKAAIPFLTIFAQINQIPLYYIFESGKMLIEIPQIPINIDWRIFEDVKNKEFFSELERKKILEKNYNDLDPGIRSLIEQADSYIGFNPLGLALWKRFKSLHRLFLLYRETYKADYLKCKENDKNIINQSLCELARKLEENPEDPDLKHRLVDCQLPDKFYCFKHKHNQQQVRIFYRVEERKTPYGETEKDIYVAAFYFGSDVHNANNEYIEAFNKFSKTERQAVENLNNFVLIDIPK